MLYCWRSPTSPLSLLWPFLHAIDRVLGNREFSWKSFLNDLDLPRASAEGRAR